MDNPMFGLDWESSFVRSTSSRPRGPDESICEGLGWAYGRPKQLVAMEYW